MARQTPFTVLQPFGTPGEPGGLDGKTLSNYVSPILTIDDTTYTLKQADSGSLVALNAPTTTTLTFPPTLPEGFVCLLLQKNVGPVTFSFGSTATNLSAITNMTSRFSFVSVIVAENVDGNSAQFLLGATSAAATASVPANVSIPTISGTAQVNQTLVAATGTWTNSPLSYTYQWIVNNVDVNGETSSSYTVRQADLGAVIKVRVTASNAAGSGTPVTSAATNAVVAAAALVPVVDTAPTISGTARDGETLTATTGIWLNTPTSYTYQWKSGGANVGTNANTYVIQSSDVGNTITVTVTAANAQGNGLPSTSAATGTVSALSGQAFTLVTPTFNSSGKFGQSMNGGRGVTAAPVITTETGTLEAWVYYGTADPGFIKVAAGQVGAAWIGMTSTGLAIGSYGSGSPANLTSSTSIKDNTWHHLAMVWSNSGGVLYVDGVSQATSATLPSATGMSFTNPFEVRYFSAASLYAWPGEVDEVAVWSTTKYTTGFTPPVAAYSGFSAGMIGLWHLNGDGTSGY